MNNDDYALVYLALMNDFDEHLSKCKKMPDHKFSLRFKIRMKLLMTFNRYAWQTPKKASFKKAFNYAIISVVMMMFFVGFSYPTYYIGDSFRVQIKNKDNVDYVYIEAINKENMTKTIEKEYRLTCDLGEYMQEEYFEELYIDDADIYDVGYVNADYSKGVYFTQLIKSIYHEEHYCTARGKCYITPEYTEVNGFDGYFLQQHEGETRAMTLCWDCGETLIDVTAIGFTKEELFEIAFSVQPVEAEMTDKTLE